MKFVYRAALVSAVLIALVVPALAEVLQRSKPAVGAVIARKSGEEVEFVDVSNWQSVDISQNLLTGDNLRTNAAGQLAVVFSDHTQVRLGKNSSLVVKQMAATGDTVLDLQSGSMWARAQRGGQGLTVETPAAAAAIRGTDWTLSVNGDQTSLIVLEGVVNFHNDHGSVSVAQGEGAVASIGQAPKKVVIVRPKDREQMLFYLSLRDAFNFMPVSPLTYQGMRQERLRIKAKPEAIRTTEEWLTLAEAQFSFDAHTDALASLAHVRGAHLTQQQSARVELFDALIAGGTRRYAEAARLFEKARRGLDGQRRSIASYGGYFARSLADPKHVEQPPIDTTGPEGALAKAYTRGFLDNIPAAIAVLKEAEKQFPNNSSLPAYRADFALLMDDRAQSLEALERSLTIDPNNPTGLEARANYRDGYESNVKGAYADLQQALKEAPGSTSMLNGLALIQQERGDNRAAEEAFKKAIELDPDDPVGHANLAVFYLDEQRVDEAKAEIDKALAVDPEFDMGLVARGRYYLQIGQPDKALDDLLAGTTANPGYSQGQLLLSAAHLDKSDRDPANQALDNADRLDPNDPVVSSFRTAIAIDRYDSDGAIRNAQEFLRRARARGGDYGSLGANQDAGSTLNNAFRLQGLNAWGQYYGDAVFDPFTGSGYVDQAIRGSVNPFANSYLSGGSVVDSTGNSSSFSSVVQGLLLDPHMLSGRSRSASILREPFAEGALGAGLTQSGGHHQWSKDAELQGYSNEPFPFSYSGDFTWDPTPLSGDFTSGTGNFSGDNKLLSADAYFTATPASEDRVVAFVNYAKNMFSVDTTQILPAVASPAVDRAIGRDDTNNGTVAGLAWSHTYGYHDIVNAALFYTELDGRSAQSLDARLLGLPAAFAGSLQKTIQRDYIAAISHVIGDDDLTWRYGVEGGLIASRTSQSVTDELAVPVPETISASTHDDTGLLRGYVDLLHNITPTLRAEYALFGTSLHSDKTDVDRLEPRTGVAWTPLDNQWLRAGYIRQSLDYSAPTLSPVDVVGLQPNQFVVGTEGYADTLALRWDSQWTDRLFTAVDFQHQQIHDLTVSDPITIPLAGDGISLSKARIDRAAVTANLAVGGGFGLSATGALANSENQASGSIGYGQSVPFVADRSGQVALTWVNEANVKATVAANYIGPRGGNEAGTKLDDYWTLDASMVWEPLDKRFDVELSAFNLLNKKFEIAPDVPGWGRVIKGTVKVRF